MKKFTLSSMKIGKIRGHPKDGKQKLSIIRRHRIIKKKNHCHFNTEDFEFAIKTHCFFFLRLSLHLRSWINFTPVSLSLYFECWKLFIKHSVVKSLKLTCGCIRRVCPMSVCTTVFWMLLLAMSKVKKEEMENWVEIHWKNSTLFHIFFFFFMNLIAAYCRRWRKINNDEHDLQFLEIKPFNWFAFEKQLIDRSHEHILKI